MTTAVAGVGPWEQRDLIETFHIGFVALLGFGTTGSQLISVASGLAAGQTVLVSGALGGVGRSAVFTAKDHGAKVIGAVLRRWSPSNPNRARRLCGT